MEERDDGERVFIVAASRAVSDTVVVDTLGVFPSLDEAMACADIYSSIDTEISDVTVSETRLYDTVPQQDVFLHYHIEDGDHVIIRSRIVPANTQPWIREEDDYMEALAYPEDRERMDDYFRHWVLTAHHTDAVFDIDVSDDVI